MNSSVIVDLNVNPWIEQKTHKAQMGLIRGFAYKTASHISDTSQLYCLSTDLLFRRQLSILWTVLVVFSRLAEEEQKF